MRLLTSSSIGRRCVCYYGLILILFPPSEGFLLSKQETRRHQSRRPVATGVAPPPSPSSQDVVVGGSVVLSSDEQVFRLLRQTSKKPASKNSQLNQRRNKQKLPSKTGTFNYVIQQLALSGEGTQAENVLRYMMRESRERAQLQPNLLTLNSVLSAYSKSQQRKSPPIQRTSNPATTSSKLSRAAKQVRAEAAYRLFLEWQNWHRSGWVNESVDLVSYNSLINCFGKAHMPEQAEEILERLKKHCETTGDDAYRPDAYSYSSLLHAYALAGLETKVGALFQHLQREGPNPTIHSYNDVLYAYSRSDHPSAADEFLQWWIEEDRGQVRPDTTSYNIVLHALTKAAQQRPDAAAERAQRVFASIPRPDPISYSTLIAVLAHIKGRPALDAIGRTVDRAWRDGYIRVDADLLSNILYSLSLCDDRNMPVVAERLVRDLMVRGVPANVRLYNALIYCWSASNDRDAPRHAVDLLAEMETSELLEPDVKSYTTALNVLSTSRDGKYLPRTEDIVRKMEVKGPAPNAHSYTALIRNYARSKLPDKATKAAGVLQRMKQRQLMPTIVSYNLVLNACEYTDTRQTVVAEESLRVACEVFDELRSKGKQVEATHVTFGSFLGVLGKLMDLSARQEIVELVFRRCCLEGKVSPYVLKKLKDASSDDMYPDLLRGYRSDRLPPSWTCHVHECRARDHEQ